VKTVKNGIAELKE